VDEFDETNTTKCRPRIRLRIARQETSLARRLYALFAVNV